MEARLFQFFSYYFMTKRNSINKINYTVTIMIDIETDTTMCEQQKRYYVIFSYSERDAEIYKDTKVNVLEFMYEKSKKYDMIPRRADEPIEDIVAQRRSREFYSLFTLNDLCVLGY